MSALGSAPGKVLLLGEHALGAGHAALAAALPLGVTVRAERHAEARIEVSGISGLAEHAVQLLAVRLGVISARLEADFALPLGCGLGSAAALCVATCRALAQLRGRPLSDAELCEHALAGERVLRRASTGIDSLTCARGGVLRFHRGPPARHFSIATARPLSLVIALSGLGGDARARLSSAGDRMRTEAQAHAPLLKQLGDHAREGADDIAKGDLKSLGRRMDETHALLFHNGLSCPELDAIILAARRGGALGAKPTGTCGGSAVALVDDPAPVLAAIRAQGFVAFAAEVSTATPREACA